MYNLEVGLAFSEPPIAWLSAEPFLSLGPPRGEDLSDVGEFRLDDCFTLPDRESRILEEELFASTMLMTGSEACFSRGRV